MHSFRVYRSIQQGEQLLPYSRFETNAFPLALLEEGSLLLACQRYMTTNVSWWVRFLAGTVRFLAGTDFVLYSFDWRLIRRAQAYFTVSQCTIEFFVQHFETDLTAVICLINIFFLIFAFSFFCNFYDLAIFFFEVLTYTITCENWFAWLRKHAGAIFVDTSNSKHIRFSFIQFTDRILSVSECKVLVINSFRTHLACFHVHILWALNQVKFCF